jgi:hypothetical protein
MVHTVHETVKKYSYDYDQPLIFSKVHHELNQVRRVSVAR